MKRGRTVSFMVLTEERIAEIREALLDYARKQYKRACELGIEKHLSLSQFEQIIRFQIDAHIEGMVSLNHAMNTMADFANSNNIAVPGSLLFKMQAFLNSIQATEFSMAAKSVGMLNDVDIEDIGGCFVAALEASFKAHATIEEEKSSPFKKLVHQIDNDDYSADEVIACFKEDIHTWSLTELIGLCDEIPNLMKLGKVLAFASPNNKRVKRLDSITTGIDKVAKEEIARRRSSN